MTTTIIVHPAISREVNLVDRSVEMAEAAFNGLATGAIEAKVGNVYLGAGRVLQGAARIRLATRLAAGKLALQEAKLIEQHAAA